MIARTPVVNKTGDHEEIVERYSKWLGKHKLRRKLFDCVYGRARTPRSLKQIMADARIKARDRQQAQNQIEYLYKHHLISRDDNDGTVSDGSLYLYSKDETVRALRGEIVKYADKPALAKKIPTKRRPAGITTSSVRTITRSALRKRTRVNVLYMTANPGNDLRVEAEVRRVQEVIRGSEFRDNIDVQYRPAADISTLLDGLNDHRPQIVHFSGHSSVHGLAMDKGKIGKPSDQSVSFELLAKALAATDHQPRLVVLNSCSSSGARKALLKLGLIVVSMKTSISDIAAVAFAPRFYAALAGGQSIRSAYRQGAVAVKHASIKEADTPELFAPAGTNPANVKLA